MIQAVTTHKVPNHNCMRVRKSTRNTAGNAKNKSQLLRMFSVSGDFVPLTPYQGLCTLTPLGDMPPYPNYRLALRARHRPLVLPITKARKVSTLTTGCTLHYLYE